MNKAEQNYRLLQKIEANRQFLLMAYQQNPKLLESAETRIKQLFEIPAHGVDNNLSSISCPPSSERGISLIELIMFIVIVSVALAGILLVMNVTTKGSADPLIHKQAIAAAESLLEEIQLQDFIDQNNGVTTICPSAASAVTPTNRASDYHIVDCYKNFPNSGPATGIYSVNGAAITDLASYTANVTVTPEGLSGIAAGDAVRITVTVTDPQGTQIAIDGYRTKY
ncbi:MAG: type II secretion system protein [Gallionella sp.]|nr:type II secretion system protein [Gallionella sp.]